MKTLTTTTLSIAAALVASTTLVGAATARAETPAYYVATPVAPPAVKAKLITRSTLWRAHGPIYFAQRAPDRTPVLCRLLADQAGPLASFSAGGKPLDADALAECNARVVGAPQAVAAK